MSKLGPKKEEFNFDLDSKSKCEDALKYFNYLRKANCENRSHFGSHDVGKCRAAVNKMNEVAIQCEDFYKKKPS